MYIEREREEERRRRVLVRVHFVVDEWPAGVSGRVRISRGWGAWLVTSILSGPLSGRRVR